MPCIKCKNSPAVSEMLLADCGEALFFYFSRLRHGLHRLPLRQVCRCMNAGGRLLLRPEDPYLFKGTLLRYAFLLTFPVFSRPSPGRNRYRR